MSDYGWLNTDLTKKCNRCKIEKPFSGFDRNPSSSNGIKSICKLCVKEYTSQYYQNNKEKSSAHSKIYYAANKERAAFTSRRSSLKTRYNMSHEQYEERLSTQKEVCLICKKPHPAGKRLAVDHNHETGKVRGLLCGPHNSGLGLFNDEPELLRRAAAYIEADGEIE